MFGDVCMKTTLRATELCKHFCFYLTDYYI